MDRREFLGLSAATAGALALPRTAAAQDAGGPYGSLLSPDANGLMLPEGFRSRVVARSGEAVAPTSYVWHLLPDGGATFEAEGGGWVYVSNSEHPTAGMGTVGALRFDAGAEVVEAYRILDGTQRNCAGGPTPWGTWLSCEEYDGGRVWECDPNGDEPARVRPALGVFSHEAVTVDPDGEQLYLTEDTPDGRLYRFTPGDYPSLDAGRLEVAVVTDGAVAWSEVPDPSGASTPTRQQVSDSTPFNGGEGIWWEDGLVHFTTKGDNKVWEYDVDAERLRTIYDPATLSSPPLIGVDNLVGTPGRDLFVAEDGGDGELVMITREGEVVPFLKVVAPPPLELAGPAFSPDGRHLHVSSYTQGITFEITGPFRDAARTERPTRDTIGSMRVGDAGGGGGDGDSSPAVPIGIGVGAAAVLAAAAAAWRLRSRQQRS